MGGRQEVKEWSGSQGYLGPPQVIFLFLFLFRVLDPAASQLLVGTRSSNTELLRLAK
jgi:hypothetical protein